VGNFHFMNFSVDHSTPKDHLGATNQAARELGGSRKFLKPKQLDLWESQKPATEYPLRIELLPPNLQWWDEPRYWLIHAASGLRVPGSWSRKEAEELQDLSKNWKWSLDKERRVDCGLQLLALAESLCKRSSVEQTGGGQ
jgi:hypothetical protein